MSHVEEYVEVNVPVRTAYSQWTQFEDFPVFMEGVERIVQRTDKLTHWVTNVNGVQREFDAQITEQLPDGPAEVAADKLGFVRRQVAGDLKRFKLFIESRGVATGAWRGKV